MKTTRKVLREKLALSREEFLKLAGEFILTRTQLKAIAIKRGVKPEFLFGSCVDTEHISEANGHTSVTTGNRKIFDRRLDALKEWLINSGFPLDNGVVILPKKYTLEEVYTDLSFKYRDLFMTIQLSSFDSHFWGKQKIVELTRGDKSAIL